MDYKLDLNMTVPGYSGVDDALLGSEYTANIFLYDLRTRTEPLSVHDCGLLSDALVVDSELKVLSSREVTMRSAQDMGLFEPGALEADEPGPLSVVTGFLRSLLSPDRADGRPDPAPPAQDQGRHHFSAKSVPPAPEHLR